MTATPTRAVTAVAGLFSGLLLFGGLASAQLPARLGAAVALWPARWRRRG